MGVFDIFPEATPATSTQTSAPWAGVQPYLVDLMNQARLNYQSGAGQNYFPGSTVVPFSPQTNTALGMMENRAMQGSPVTRSAQTQITDTLGGKYLDPTQNPAYRFMADDVTNKVNSAFSLAGRTGSPAHAGTLAKGIMQGGAGMYDAERARQMQSLGMAGPVGQMDLTDAQLMAQSGTAREGQANQQIQDLMSRFNFSQQAPNAALQQYMQIVQGIGNQGGTQTTTDRAGNNPFLNILSGAATGGGIAGWPGAAIGAGLGLLG